jgi:hypothetical protein
MDALLPAEIVESAAYVLAGAAGMQMLTPVTSGQAIVCVTAAYAAGKIVYVIVKNVGRRALPCVPGDLVRIGSWALGCLAATYAGSRVVTTGMNFMQLLGTAALSSIIGAEVQEVAMGILRWN